MPRSRRPRRRSLLTPTPVSGHMSAADPAGPGVAVLDGFAPVPLDEAPAVSRLLEELGLGGFDADDVRTRPGRNRLWFGVTTTGVDVFAKELTGDPGDVASRWERTLAFHRSAAARQIAHPRLLGADGEDAVVAFEYLAGVTGVELMVREEFSPSDAAAVGDLVGALHASPIGDESALRVAHPAERFLKLASAIPAPLYEQLSMAQLHAWRLLQRDEPLLQAIRSHLAAPPPRDTLVHGDLRVDQLLRVEGRWLLTDWEEFGAGDPARDVGSFVGEWMNRAILDVPTDRGDDRPFDVEEMTHELMMQRAIEKILRLQPIVSAFWSAYAHRRCDVDEAMRRRVVFEAGWHLIDRMLASAMDAARLGGIQRAAAGIGRAMMIGPEQFGDAIGLA